jgi:hypothetical protein
MIGPWFCRAPMRPAPTDAWIKPVSLWIYCLRSDAPFPEVRPIFFFSPY